MYLFTRSRRVEPEHFVKAMESVGELTEHGRKITGRQIDAWSAVMSPEVGTIVWSLWAEKIGEIEQAGDALVADGGFMKLVEKTDDLFDGPFVDGIATLVHGDLNLDDTSFEYVGVATATLATGHLQDGIAAGIEIADHVKQATGDDTLFLVNTTGIFGGVAWVTPMANSAAVDDGEVALMASAEWLPLLDRVGSAFNVGAAQALYRRIA
jgi:hypothetical protein